MSRIAASLLACAVLLASATAAVAAQRTSLSDIEDEVMCPTCGTALSLSESPLADRMRVFIQRRIDDGRSKAEIKSALVDEFGPEVLATPARHGFSLAAYLVPLAGLVIAVVSIAVTLLRRRGPPGQPDATPAGDDFEALVDADLARLRR